MTSASSPVCFHRQLLLLLLFLSGQTFAQEPVYQLFDVDSVAQPRGGMAYLNTFLQANLRKPITAQAKGREGRVFVSGIVEADGRISSVAVMKSQLPELNREAVRVFSLFNAWQPAKKGGKAVRQQVSIPVTFAPNTPFPYVDGAQVSYFDADNKPVAEESEVRRYKQVAPLDTNGLPTGDIVVYKIVGTGWKEEYRIPLLRRKSEERSAANKPVYQVGYQNGQQQWHGTTFNVTDDGMLMDQATYQYGQRRGLQLTYHPGGVVAERIEEDAQKQAIRSWYPNGQITEIGVIEKPQSPEATLFRRVTAFWDSTGQQLVRDGNGPATHVSRVTSYQDTTRQTRYVEQGQYRDSFKQGVWTGRYADGSFSYEEQYDKGVCLGGKAVTAGGTTVGYTTPEERPQFEGGMPGFFNFLNRTMRYPAEASQAKQQGKVFVSFVVCTDGTLCDYKVIKGAAPSLDAEALRVIKATSGRWKPGTQRGQKKRVKFNMPINFSLN